MDARRSGEVYSTVYRQRVLKRTFRRFVAGLLVREFVAMNVANGEALARGARWRPREEKPAAGGPSLSSVCTT